MLAEIHARGPRLVALPGLGGTPCTYGAFARFGDGYLTLRAKEELRITAAALALERVPRPATTVAF